MGGTDSRAHSRRWHQVRLVSGQPASHPHLGWPGLIPPHWPPSRLTARQHTVLDASFPTAVCPVCACVYNAYEGGEKAGRREEGEATRGASKRWVGWEVRRGRGRGRGGSWVSLRHQHTTTDAVSRHHQQHHHHHHYCTAAVTPSPPQLLLPPLLLLHCLHPRPTPALATPPDPDWGTRGAFTGRKFLPRRVGRRGGNGDAGERGKGGRGVG